MDWTKSEQFVSYHDSLTLSLTGFLFSSLFSYSSSCLAVHWCNYWILALISQQQGWLKPTRIKIPLLMFCHRRGTVKRTAASSLLTISYVRDQAMLCSNPERHNCSCWKKEFRDPIYPIKSPKPKESSASFHECSLLARHAEMSICTYSK